MADCGQGYLGKGDISPKGKPPCHELQMHPYWLKGARWKIIRRSPQLNGSATLNLGSPKSSRDSFSPPSPHIEGCCSKYSSLQQKRLIETHTDVPRRPPFLSTLCFLYATNNRAALKVQPWRYQRPKSYWASSVSVLAQLRHFVV